MKYDQLTALVIEDHQEMAEIIASALEEKGFSVDIAGNGIKAYGSIENINYDVITVDLDIPFASGIQIIRTLPSTLNKNAKVFVISAYDLEKTKNGVELQNIEKIYKKPFDITEFSSVIEKYFN